MSVVTSLVRPVVRPISSNLILPSRSQAFPSSGFLEAGYASPSQSLDGLVYGQEPFSGTQRAEQVGRWYEFDGTNDYISISPVSYTNSTISAWIKPTAALDIVFGTDGSTSGYIYLLSSSSVRVNAGSSLDFDVGEMLDGKWHCLTVTREGTSFRVYLDGIESSDGAQTGTSYAPDRIGYFNTVGSSQFDGGMKNMLAYSRALSLTEVRRLYTHPTEIDTTDLELFYDGEDTHPTIAYDRSGNGNHGTKTNITASTFHAESSVQSDCPFSHENAVGYSEGLYLAGGTGVYTKENSWIGHEVWDGDFTVEFEIQQANSLVIVGVAAEALQATNSYLPFDFSVNWQSTTQIRTWENGTATIRSAGKTIGDRTRHKFIRVGSTITYYLDDVEIYSVTNAAPMWPVMSFNSLSNQAVILYHNGTVPRVNSESTDLGSQDLIAFPRDESDKTKDVFGGTLGYSGKAPANAQLKKSGCATFNGTTSYADGDTAAITGYPFTMMARVKPTGGSLGTVCALTDRDNSSYYYGFGYDNGDRVYIVFRNSVVQSHTEDIELDESDAHLAVVFVSETRAKFYRNGVLLLDKSNFTSSSFWAGIDSYTVGCTRISSPTSFYDGAVWDFRVYDGEKTASEILAISQGQSAYDQTNLAVGLPMEEQAGSKHYDVSPNGSHADITALTESVHYGDTQDSHHYSRTKGFSDYVNYLAYSNGTTGWNTNGVSLTLEDGYQRLEKDDDLGSRSISQVNATTIAGVYSARFTVKAGTFDLCDFGILDSSWVVERVQIVSGSGTTSINGGLARVSGLDSSDTVVEFQVTTTLADRAIYLYPGSAFTGGSGNHMFCKDWHVWEGTLEDRPSYVDTTGTAFYESNKPALADGSACAATGEAITNAAGSFFNNYPGGEVDLNPNNAPKRNNAVMDNLVSTNAIADWTNARLTITDSATESVAGIQDAALFVVNNTEPNGAMYLQNSPTFEANKQYVLSVFAKPGGFSTLRLSFADTLSGYAGGYSEFDLSAVSITANDGRATGAIESIGNGWVRCSMEFTTQASPDYHYYAANIMETGNGSNGVYLDRPKLEQWHEATPFIESDRASEDLPHDWEMPVPLTDITATADSTWDGSDLVIARTSLSTERVLIAGLTVGKEYSITYDSEESVSGFTEVSPELFESDGSTAINFEDGDNTVDRSGVVFTATDTTVIIRQTGNGRGKQLNGFQLQRNYKNPLFFREITSNGNLHRVDRMAFYNTVLTGARVDAVEQYTAETTV